MKKAVCPRCGSFDIIMLVDGNIRCNSCEYTGLLIFNKDLFKKM